MLKSFIHRSKLNIATILSNLALLFTPWLDWYGDSLGTLSILLDLFAYGFFLATLMLSLLNFFKNTSQKTPLILHSVGIFLFLLTVKTVPYMYMDFYLRLNEREKIISMIEENQLSPNSNSDLIVLPSTQKSLSEGGSVLFTELSDNSFSILFYTNRGLIDNYAGFLFKSDNKNIQKTDYWGSTYKVKTLKPHWFWINFN